MSRRFVVVEYGAGSFNVPVAPDGTDETILVVQASDEGHAPFSLRLGTRLAVLERANQPFNPAILVVSPAYGPQAASARKFVAVALLSHMAARGEGDLVIVAPLAEAALRHELLGLFEALLEEFSQTNVGIRLQFRAEPAREASQSGIHPVPSPTGLARSAETLRHFFP